MTGRVWRTFRGVVLLLIVTTVGMVLALLVVGRGIDQHQVAKEARLLELRLSTARQAMVADLTAATIWDEAVMRLSGHGDVDWADRHLGPFFAAQSGHVATLAYDGEDRLIRASIDGKPVSSEQGHAFIRAAAPMIADVRRETTGRDRSAIAMDAVRSESGFAIVEGRVYQMAATSVVRHTDKGPLIQSDPIVASFKPFETLVARLEPELGLVQPQIQPKSAFSPQSDGQASLTVSDPGGHAIGRIVWTPETVGTQIVSKTTPLLIALVLAMGLAGAWVFRSIAAEVRRLADSEAALAAALERAEEGSAAKSRFLANISHELRTPLNGVLGMAEVLEGDLLTPQQRDRMAVLKAAGKQQLRLIENLLFVTRLQSGAVSLTSAAFSPADLLEGLASEWRSMAAGKGLTLTVVPGAPPQAIGDARQIERLLDALVDNAVRMSAQGDVTLSARKVKRDLILEVGDAGPGFDPAFMAYVERLGEGERPVADGAGLGLPIVLSLVSMMNGSACVLTQPGPGARFVVRLPQRAPNV